MNRKDLQRWSLVIASLSFVALLAWPTASIGQGQPAPSSTQKPGASVTFSGQATGIRATVLRTTTVLSDTGPLPPSGGAQEASLLTASAGGVLTAEVLHTATVGQGDRTRSEASVANLSLNAGGSSISAGFLMARAMALCAPTNPLVSGSSEIADLVINGQAITVTGQPNQMVQLPLGTGKVVINEQTFSTANRKGDITVNALHVIVNGGVADVVISSAHADISCQAPPQCAGAQDFITGGGWITSPSGAKANFGVAGGIKNGAFWGHLVYIDHGPSGPKVKGTGVTAYTIVDATTRHIEGTAEVNGQAPFTYKVDVADNGEPGVNIDTFALTLSNGYSASGKLEGGNIQLHKPCH